MGSIPLLIAQMEKDAGHIPLLARLYSRLYDRVIRNEIALAGITHRDWVLNVGCGGVPFTAMQLARIAGAHVWAIDRDERAAQAARRCVHSAGLERQITVMALDGTSALPFQFDVAIVALQVEPKEAVLENLLLHSTLNTRVVFRNPRHYLFKQYDVLPAAPVPSSRVSQKQLTFDSSVLYRPDAVRADHRYEEPCSTPVSREQHATDGGGDRWPR